MGFTIDDHSTTPIDYSHVKRVAILGESQQSNANNGVRA